MRLAWADFEFSGYASFLLPRREAVKSLASSLGQFPFFWRAHDGAGLDLLIVRGQHRHGFEIKRTDAPRVTPSMRNALVDLHLDRLTVVHAGVDEYPLGERIRAVPLVKLLKLSARL